MNPARTSQRTVDAPPAGPPPADRPTRAILTDGSPVLLARLGPECAGELLDLHRRLSERDRYLRFTTVHPADLERYVERTLSPEGGAVSLRARVRGRLAGVVQLLPVGGDAVRSAVRDALSRTPEGDWLLPPETTDLCRAAGVATVPTAWVTTIEEAVAAAGRVVAEWMVRAGDRWLGAVVQPRAPAGDELLVGAVRDPAAGPVVALGPGGRAADALGHRVHRLAPPTVSEMMSGTGLFAPPTGGDWTTAASATACAAWAGWPTRCRRSRRSTSTRWWSTPTTAWRWTCGSGSGR